MTRVLIESLTRKDFKIDWFSGTGAGGQHRNKHQNCVRITHIETGITVTGQNHRERSRNFKEAFEEIANRIAKLKYSKEPRPRVAEDNVIRTYNESENRITDHVTGEKTSFDDFDLDRILSEKLSLKSD